MCEVRRMQVDRKEVGDQGGVEEVPVTCCSALKCEHRARPLLSQAIIIISQLLISNTGMAT